MTDKPRIDVAALLARVDIVDVISRHVELKKSGAEFEACCPFHTEYTPSFKVSPAKQMYHCFGCGANGNAIGFLIAHQGLSFLDACAVLGGDAALPVAGSAPTPAPAKAREPATPWIAQPCAPGDAPEPPKAHYARGLPQRVWAYRSATGALLGLVYRFARSDGGKDVLPVVWGKHGETGAEEWRWMAFAEPRPLYGLDRLAAMPDAPVLLVEGEKCADAGHEELSSVAERAGYAVVSWPGGGKADGKVDWSPLAGRRVITWADADAKREKLTPDEAALGVDQAAKPLLPDDEQPGFQTMARIRERLRSMDCTLYDVRLPPPGSKPDGWDIADAVAEGIRGRDLAKYIKENARSAVPRMTREQAEQVATASLSDGTAARRMALESAQSGRVAPQRREGPLLLDAVAWLDDAQPMEWVIDGLIQRGCLYAMTGVTNHGKTAIGLLMAMSIAVGRRFAERETAQGAVLILCGENPDGFRTRLHATLESMNLERGDVAKIVYVLPQAVPLASAVEQILAEGRALGVEFALVMIDTSVSFFSGDDENDNLQARANAWHQRALTELPGHPAVIAATHPVANADKDSLVPRGGGAYLNEVDSNLTVWADGESATLHWVRKKRGPDFDPIPFEYHGRTIEEHGRKVPTVYAAHITEAREREIARARADQEDRLLRAMLREPEGNYVDWANACGLNGAGGKSQVSRVMRQLQKDGLVKDHRRRKVLTPAGEKEARAAGY